MQQNVKMFSVVNNNVEQNAKSSALHLSLRIFSVTACDWLSVSTYTNVRIRFLHILTFNCSTSQLCKDFIKLGRKFE